MIRQYATFRLNEHLYGIDVLLVREINRHIDLTEVSPAPEFVRGLVNLRGQIVTIIDPGVRLGLGTRQMLDTSCSIVLKTRQETDRMVKEGLLAEHTPKDTVGILVDSIDDMVLFDEQEIEAPPPNVNGVDGTYISGLIKLENQLLSLLRLDRLLSSAQ